MDGTQQRKEHQGRRIWARYVQCGLVIYCLIHSNIVGTIREYFHIHELSDHYAQQTSSVDAIAARDLDVGAR